MQYFPFFFNLKEINCLIVGGGDIALNKVRLLLQANAQLIVVATEIKAEITTLLNQHNGEQRLREFKSEDIHDAEIIIVATNNNELNQRVQQLARRYKKFVNVVDDIEKCDFIFPALVNRGDLTVAISTSGVAPTIASWLRSKLETELPQSWTSIMAILRQQQGSIRKNIPDVKQRRRFYRSLIDNLIPRFLHQVFTQEGAENDSQQFTYIAHQITDHLRHCANNENEGDKRTSVIKTGKVYLVGAGPGDPELLSLRAQQILQQADIVLYDRLLNQDLLDYTRRDAEKIFVGKQAKHHHKTQEEINHLMVKYAKQGNIVVRLKGGDPFVFGRGGEEIEVLSDHGVVFEVVPGISAVNGIAANLGIPLTLRGVSDKLLLTSIYVNQQHGVNWQQLAMPRQTLVLYMGLQNLAEIATQLIVHGLAEKTAIAMVEKGTWREQKTLYSTLEQVASPEYQPKIKLQSPVLSIIGDVVTKRRGVV